MKINQFCQRYESNCAKMPYLAMLSNPSKKIPGYVSRCGWLPKFNEFFPAQRYSSGKIFTKIRSVAFTEVANKQTNRWRDKYRVKYNLLGWDSNNINKNLKHKDRIQLSSRRNSIVDTSSRYDQNASFTYSEHCSRHTLSFQTPSEL